MKTVLHVYFTGKVKTSKSVSESEVEVEQVQTQSAAAGRLIYNTCRQCSII